MAPTDLALLLVAGLAAGCINVIAGGGSFLTLPILIFVGLPPTMANGTNRVAILLQNVGAVWGFQRHRVVEWRLTGKTALPAAVGAGLGSWLALEVGDDNFRRILAILMLVVTTLTLIPGHDEEIRPRRHRAGWTLFAAFFLIGIYGGFVQAGVGFFILAGTTWAGLDLVRGNALKVLAILAFSLVSLPIFALAGQVDWVAGLTLAVGNVCGGLVGVKLSVDRGQRFIRRIVAIAIVVFAIRLWFFG